MWKRFILLPLCLLLLFLTGCSLKYPSFLKKQTSIANISANAIFTNGPAIYNETVNLINSAHKSIYVEQATFNDPRLIQLLIQKAQAGLDIHILLDQWQPLNKPTLDELKNQNVSVQFYPAQKGQYDDTKLLVIDNERAMVYGASWTSDNFNSPNVAVELTGYSAWKTGVLFANDWTFTTTLSLNVPKTSSLPDDHIILATDANVKQQVLQQISSSTKSIWVETNFISEQDTVQALIDAASQGRDIRLILDPAASKETPETIEKLKAAGIKIRYSKTFGGNIDAPNIAIFDGTTFILSSSGWTHFTFVINHEFSITVPSPVATNKLVQTFNQDWAQSS